MVRIIILCAGQASRWAPKQLKQLVPINDEPLLHRTVRLLRDFGYSDIHIAHHDPQLHVEGCQHFTPSDSRWVMSTLYSSRHLWTDRTIILLGDVYFTTNALQKILECPSEIQFVGRLGPSSYTGCPSREIFCLLFRDSVHSKLEHVLTNIMKEAEYLHRATIRHYYKRTTLYLLWFFRSIQKRKQFHIIRRIRWAHTSTMWNVNLEKFISGRLWKIYCAWANFSLEDRVTASPFFMHIDDFTEDFDTLQDYKEWLARFAQFHTHDAQNHEILLRNSTLSIP